jgi:hypothetical protein
MSVLSRKSTIGLSVIVLCMGLVTSAWGQVGGGGGLGVGGELRGPTVIAGKVICAQCSINDVRASQPNLQDLYELRHTQEGRIVMQIAPPQDTLAYNVWWQSDGAMWWMSIAGPDNIVSMRTPNYLFRQLMAEENLLREVQMTGLLRRNKTYDVDSVTYLESIPSPLAAVQRAEEAARRAQAAAGNREASVGRAEDAADRLMAMTNTTEQQFTTNLMK